MFGHLQGEVMVFQPMLIKEISLGGALVETRFPLHLNSLHDLRLTLGTTLDCREGTGGPFTDQRRRSGCGGVLDRNRVRGAVRARRVGDRRIHGVGAITSQRRLTSPNGATRTLIRATRTLKRALYRSAKVLQVVARLDALGAPKRRVVEVRRRLHHHPIVHRHGSEPPRVQAVFRFARTISLESHRAPAARSPAGAFHRPRPRHGHRGRERRRDRSPDRRARLRSSHGL